MSHRIWKNAATSACDREQRRLKKQLNRLDETLESPDRGPFDVARFALIWRDFSNRASIKSRKGRGKGGQEVALLLVA